MDAEIAVEVLGKIVTAVTGLPMGLLLVRRWRRTGSRVVLHWAIFFLAAGGYLFGALVMLERGDPTVFTRLHYLLGAASIVPGALAGTVLMLPLPTRWAYRLSLHLPLALFLLMAVLFLLAPLQPGSVRQVYIYGGFTEALYRGLCIGTGLFAIVTLVYLGLRLRNAAYLALALAFVLISMGGWTVGQHLITMVIGRTMVVAGFAIFYFVFGALMRGE